jgi:mannosylglycerate hydrolase
MAKRPLRAHIVSQTHWDREWYLPFEEFRFRLVRLMDRVFNLFETQPGYRHFVCDGQTILLDDYLAIRPEREADLRRYIQEGRLVIGPWHVLPDEFIVSGESLIRNLLMARRVAARFGKHSNAGYVPDPFGHVAQLPQILAGFGIDTFIFLRGMPQAEKWGTEFFWEAPDRRSTVLAIWMKNIYFNASLLGYESGWGDSELLAESFSIERAMKQLKGQVDDLGRWTRRGNILLNNGCDHTPPQYEIPQVIDAANKHFKEEKFVHSTYDKFAHEVKKAPGKLRTMRDVELRSSRYIVILPGVLSARMYLKQWNRECEALLERWAEPSCALAQHLGGENHAGSLVEAWRLLLENHPHDSICGCSVDAVHREMMIRFEKIAQLARSVRDFQLWGIESRINTAHPDSAGSIISWNPLFTQHRGPLCATVTMPADAPRHFRLVDSAGAGVTFQIASVAQRTETSYLSFNKPLKDIEIAIASNQSGWGYRTFHVLPTKPGQRDADIAWCRKATDAGIETAEYRIKFHSNGSFDLKDKHTGALLRNVLVFEDTEDAGDEYDYSHAARGARLTTADAAAKVKLVARGAVFAEYSIAIPWRLPRSLSRDRQRRSNATVDATLRVTMRVYKEGRRIDFALRADNRALDHRLRVLFPGPSNVKESVADGHFATVRRPLHVETTPQHDGLEPSTHHMRHWVALFGDDHGVAVLNRRLTEYEILSGPRGSRTIAITLLRSVGWLSRKDLLTRPNFAGPMIETPEAQCLGPMKTEFSLLPVAARDAESEIIAEAESYAAPVLLRWATPHDGPLPPDNTWIELHGKGLVGSTWKPAEDDNGSVLRYYNPMRTPREIDLKTAAPLRIAGRCNLGEDSVQGTRGCPKSVGGCEIQTLRLGGSDQLLKPRRRQ